MSHTTCARKHCTGPVTPKLQAKGYRHCSQVCASLDRQLRRLEREVVRNDRAGRTNLRDRLMEEYAALLKVADGYAVYAEVLKGRVV